MRAHTKESHPLGVLHVYFGNQSVGQLLGPEVCLSTQWCCIGKSWFSFYQQVSIANYLLTSSGTLRIHWRILLCARVLCGMNLSRSVHTVTVSEFLGVLALFGLHNTASLKLSSSSGLSTSSSAYIPVVVECNWSP